VSARISSSVLPSGKHDLIENARAREDADRARRLQPGADAACAAAAPKARPGADEAGRARQFEQGPRLTEAPGAV
jgi:hypothetical protein